MQYGTLWQFQWILAECGQKMVKNFGRENQNEYFGFSFAQMSLIC